MKWISIEEQLPYFDKEVLATDGKTQWVALRFQIGKHEHFLPTLQGTGFNPTHWMELPKLPEEKQ